MDSDAHNSDQSLPAILFGPQWPPVYHQTFCDPMKYRFESNLEIHIIGAVGNPHSDGIALIQPVFPWPGINFIKKISLPAHQLMFIPYLAEKKWLCKALEIQVCGNFQESICARMHV